MTAISLMCVEEGKTFTDQSLHSLRLGMYESAIDAARTKQVWCVRIIRFMKNKGRESMHHANSIHVHVSEF